jgi:hypothetical protein
MSTEAITLEIDSEAAQAFKSVSIEEREKLQVLLGIWLKEYAKADTASWIQVVSATSGSLKNTSFGVL